jgi:hypothetical protein
MREFDQEGTPADADALLQEHLVGRWFNLQQCSTQHCIVAQHMQQVSPCQAVHSVCLNPVPNLLCACCPSVRLLLCCVLLLLLLLSLLLCVPVQRCVDAAKATFKAIAVSEPRVRGAAKAGLREALQQRYGLIREAVLARAAARVDAQLLKAAQQVTTVRLATSAVSVVVDALVAEAAVGFPASLQQLAVH